MSRFRKLGLESLETRRLFAGDVTVTVERGDVLIRGDAQANQIEITQTGSRLVISGSARAFLSPTTINGQKEVVLAGARFGNVTIQMGDGSDRVNVHDVALQQYGEADWRIDLGRGSDTALIDNVNFPRDLSVIGGAAHEAGDEEIRLKASDIGRSATINLGGGAQDLASIDNSTFGADLTLNGQDGADFVGVAGNEVEGTMTVNMGAGNDMLMLMSNLVGQAVLNGGSDMADPNAPEAFNRDVLLRFDLVFESNYDPAAVAQNFEHIYDVQDLMTNPDYDGLEDQLIEYLEQLGIE